MSWYVLHVHTGKEMQIMDAIHDLGYTASVPMEIILERRRGEWIPVTRIIFKGYVFTELELNIGVYYALRQLDGVIRFLGTPPQVITEKEVQALMILGLSGKPLEVSGAELAPDGTHRFVSGPLHWLRDKILKMKCKPRFRRVRVDIPIAGEIKQIDLSYQVIPPESVR